MKITTLLTLLLTVPTLAIAVDCPAPILCGGAGGCPILPLGTNACGDGPDGVNDCADEEQIEISFEADGSPYACNLHVKATVKYDIDCSPAPVGPPWDTVEAHIVADPGENFLLGNYGNNNPLAAYNVVATKTMKLEASQPNLKKEAKWITENSFTIDKSSLDCDKDHYIVVFLKIMSGPKAGTILGRQKKKFKLTDLPIFGLSCNCGDCDDPQDIETLHTDNSPDGPVQDSFNCPPGTNEQRQVVCVCGYFYPSELPPLDCEDPTYDLTFDGEGLVETQDMGYDVVRLNGQTITESIAQAGGCAMALQTGSVQLLDVSPATKIELCYDTVDIVYHVGAFGRITQLTVEGPKCANEGTSGSSIRAFTVPNSAQVSDARNENPLNGEAKDFASENALQAIGKALLVSDLDNPSAKDGDPISGGKDITLNVDPSENPLLYRRVGTNQWKPVPNQNVKNQALTVRVFHYGTYQLFIGNHQLDESDSVLNGPFVFGDVFVYPNPVSPGQTPTLHVELPFADSLKVRIYDVAGDLVLKANVPIQPQVKNGKPIYEFPLDRSKFTSGIYYGVVSASKRGESDLSTKIRFTIIK